MGNLRIRRIALDQLANKFYGRRKEVMILGWSGGHHDAAACLLFSDSSGTHLSCKPRAVHMERYTGVKNDPRIQFEGLYRLVNTELLSDIEDVIVVGHQNPKAGGGPLNHLDRSTRKRILSQRQEAAERNEAVILDWLRDLTWHGFRVWLTNTEHHQSHMLAAWHSIPPAHPADRRGILSVDAVGELTTAAYWLVPSSMKKEPELVGTIPYPHSLGLFYSAMTEAAGWAPNQDEYKLMALSQNADRSYIEEMHQVWPDILDVGNWHHGTRHWLRENPKAVGADLLKELLAAKDRMRIAMWAQALYERHLLAFVKASLDVQPVHEILLTGGCALNCVANAYVMRNLEGVNLLPYWNPGDAGSAAGAALAAARQIKAGLLEKPFPDLQPGLRMDSESQNRALKALIRAMPKERNEPWVHALIFNDDRGDGDMSEWGPRALGWRSLVALPNNASIKKLTEIKQREEWQPYGITMTDRMFMHLFPHLKRLATPYMNTVVHLNDIVNLPETNGAVIEALRTVATKSGTVRVQVIDKEFHSVFYDLLEHVWDKFGAPILINTSLNEKGQPIPGMKADAEFLAQSLDVYG